MSNPRRREYLIEFIPIGHAIKVCAVDPVTKIEVSIVGPTSAGEEELKRTAVRKLEYVLEKKGFREKGKDGRKRRGLLI
jgi:hypothetical protein